MPLGALLVVAALLAAAYGLHEAGVWRLPHPERAWQVPNSWIMERPLLGAAAFGLILGAGVFTFIPFTSFYLLLIWELLAASPVAGAVLGGAYGLARALPVLAGAWTTARGAPIAPLHVRLLTAAPGLHRATSGLLLVTAGLLRCRCCSRSPPDRRVVDSPRRAGRFQTGPYTGRLAWLPRCRRPPCFCVVGAGFQPGPPPECSQGTGPGREFAFSPVPVCCRKEDHIMNKVRLGLLSVLLAVPVLFGCDTGTPATAIATVIPTDIGGAAAATATALPADISGAATAVAPTVNAAATAVAPTVNAAATAVTTAVNGAASGADAAYLEQVNDLATQMQNSPELSGAITAMTDAATKAPRARPWIPPPSPPP